MKQLFAFSMVVLIVGVSSIAQAATITFQEGTNVISSDNLINISNYTGTKDTSLVQESANNNYGGRPNLLVGVLGAGKVRGGLIRFDLTSLAGQYASIDSITLRLNVDATSANMPVVLALEREGNAQWGEGTVDSAVQAGSACWNYEQYNTSGWLGGSSGARTASDVYGNMFTTPTLTAAVNPVGSWVDFTFNPSGLTNTVNTLTKLVDFWIQGGGTNNAGVLLSYATSTGNPQWIFRSSEYSNVALRPQLLISYTAIPEPSTWALVALALVPLFLRRRK